MKYFVLLFLALLSLLPASCLRPGPQPADSPEAAIIALGGESPEPASGRIDAFTARLAGVLEAAELPPPLRDGILRSGDAFASDLAEVLAGPGYLRQLVDPLRALPAGYVPEDLVPLAGGSYVAGREGMLLRDSAAAALERMARAARADGIVLVASSAYRSFEYQSQVHERYVREHGRQAAERFSARPGHSQHQTGLAVDFGSIDDSFAATPSGRWMAVHAGDFGWSLSYPEGLENITGYVWESWHFRYMGRELVAFTDTYFGGVQQYALRFLHEWEKP